MKNYGCIVVAEGQFSGTFWFETRAELDAFRVGIVRGACLYGAGACGVYTMKDADDLTEDDAIRSMIREHLR